MGSYEDSFPTGIPARCLAHWCAKPQEKQLRLLLPSLKAMVAGRRHRESEKGHSASREGRALTAGHQPSEVENSETQRSWIYWTWVPTGHFVAAILCFVNCSNVSVSQAARVTQGRGEETFAPRDDEPEVSSGDLVRPDRALAQCLGVLRRRVK